MKIVFLGTGAGNGVPSFFCDCAACQEARDDFSCRRTRSALLLAGEDHTLIDAPPDLRLQLERAGVRHLERVFLTHWHYDHFGGLGELEFYCQLTRAAPLPVYLPAAALDSLKTAFPHLLDYLELRPLEAWQKVGLPGLNIQPLPARHGVPTFGYLIEQAGSRLAYFPDTGGFAPEVEELLHGVGTLILDATFNGTNWYPGSHLSVQEAVQWSQRLKSNLTYLTHLSMHYSQPVTRRELEGALQDQPRILLARDGLEISLNKASGPLLD